MPKKPKKPSTPLTHEQLGALAEKKEADIVAVMPLLTAALTAQMLREAQGKTPDAREATQLRGLIAAMPPIIMQAIERERSGHDGHPVGEALAHYVVFKTQVPEVIEGAETKAKRKHYWTLGGGNRAEAAFKATEPRIKRITSKIENNARGDFKKALINTGVARDMHSAGVLVEQVDRALSALTGERDMQDLPG